MEYRRGKLEWKYQGVRVAQVLPPQRPQLVLPSDVPHREGHVLVLNFLHVETCTHTHTMLPRTVVYYEYEDQRSSMRDAYRLSAPSTELRRRAAGTVPSFCRRRPAQASQPAPYSRASEQLKHRKRNPFRQIELSRSTVCLSVCTNGTHHRPSSPSLLSGRSRRRRASSETGPCLNSPSVVFPRTHRTPPFFPPPSFFLCIYVRVDGGCQPVMQATTPLCSCISLCSTHLDRTVPT